MTAAILVTGLWPVPAPVVRVTQLINDTRRKGPWFAVSGDRLIYTALELGKEAWRWDLWSVPKAGGEARKEPTPCTQMGGGALLQGVSYIRQRLFLQCRTAFGEADLWLTGFDGGNAKSIGHFRNVHLGGVFISPGLEMLVFSRREGLFVRPVDGGAERQLAPPDVSNVLFDSFWHPAGDRIGFLRKVDGLLKAWEVRTDGTGLRPLVPEFAGEQYDAQWSPDGQRLYFVSHGDIYLQRGRGWLGWMHRPVPARLTAVSTRFFLPTEDPADPLVIYSQGVVPQAEAMKLDRKTNAWEPFLAGMAAERWSFSPDGQWIAYLNWPRRELRKCRRDGSGAVLLEDRLFCASPRWSPDGSRIAFSGLVRPRGRFDVDTTKPFHLYTISSNGGKPEPVPGVTGLAYDPTWSPEGSRLVYAPLCGEVPKEQQHASIVNLDTGVVQAVPGSDGLSTVRWSPDGKWLVALGCDKTWPYVYSFATRKWAVLQPREEGFPEWSRDSRSVYFAESVSEARLVRIEVATGKVQEVRKLTEFPTTGLTTDASWTPEEEPVVLKDTSTYQIYRIERDR